MADFTNLASLVKLIGNRRALELLDDDDDEAISETDDAVKFAMDSANALVKSVLYQKGFTVDQLDALTADPSLQRYATSLFAQYAGQRKPEFTDENGRAPFHAMGEQARKDLGLYASGELRSILEATTVGRHAITEGEVSLATPAFVVARDPRYPGSRGPGGF